MNHVRKISMAVTLAVLLICIVGSYMTRGSMQHLSFLNGRTRIGTRAAKGLVDQRPWQTAQTLAAMAVSSEEKDFSREALRLADHEVDQAFAQALREASAETETRQLKGKALELQQRVTELQQTVKEDQARVTALTAKVAADGPGAAGDDLDIAKAQLGLDNDELSDSQEDLARETGDKRGKIQQELSARETAMKKYDAESGGDAQTAVISVGRFRTLAGQISAWWAQRSRMDLLDQAEQQAQTDAKNLSADHDRIEAAAKSSESADAGAKASGSVATGAARVKVLQRMATQRNILSILDDRIGAHQQLAVIYGRWGDQVALQHSIAAHLILQSIAWIAMIILLTLLAGWGLLAMIDKLGVERRQRHTLRTVVNLGTQLVGLVLVMLVVFGTPAQMPTILGLATAGLTVVFQDFILAFFGWFVLMGKNGIHVGDWVEIDGVGGEVAEVGVFRTALLETGNWTANGHPTGRRVSFLNSFAIRGRYFNFSTSGQWMWDEIKVSLPAGKESYPLIKKIHEAVLKATEEDVKLAEAEWARATAGKNESEGLAQFSAKPTVDIRPAGGGIDVVARYVTRAATRLETRNKLFGIVVELMRGGQKLEEGERAEAVVQS